MLNKGLFTSSNQCWTTPIELFNQLNKEFNFECDLCASDDNALCIKYFTEENSCLDNKWSRSNFCNPPYTTKFQDKIFKRAHDEVIKGNTTVLLVPARTDTIRFHDYVFKYNYEIRFIKGRLKFGNAKNSAPFPSCIIIFRK